MNLEDLLPPQLRGPDTKITPIAAGLSGAGVYRVEAAGQSFVLKTVAPIESAEEWRRAVDIQRLAAAAGLAPRIVHVDLSHRAVLTEFIVDRSFLAFYFDPRSHEAALTELGRTVRRIHALPTAGLPVRDARQLFRKVFDEFLVDFAVPSFAGAAISRVLAEEPPPPEGPPVLCHNDPNPSNIVYDGQRILMLDWAVAAPMDAYFDLGVLGVFLRMDGKTARGLLSAYAERPIDALPDGFQYHRRLAATMAGAFGLYLARKLNHPGASGTETVENTLSLVEFYQQLRGGTLKLGTPDGQWAFGLALIKEGLELPT